MLYNAWSHVIVALRRRRNFSQQSTAGRAKISLRTWRRWETGRRTPSPAYLESIAAALGCSPQKLGFEYSRLLFRYYCKQMGYEFPDLRGERGPEPPSPQPSPPANALGERGAGTPSPQLTQAGTGPAT